MYVHRTWLRRISFLHLPIPTSIFRKFPSTHFALAKMTGVRSQLDGRQVTGYIVKDLIVSTLNVTKIMKKWKDFLKTTELYTYPIINMEPKCTRVNKFHDFNFKFLRKIFHPIRVSFTTTTVYGFAKDLVDCWQCILSTWNLTFEHFYTTFVF